MNIRPLVKSEEYLAFFKYNGKLVEDGYLDARLAAEALQGIDEVLRYFIVQNDMRLAESDFEIPIQIRKGSWEALIPHDLTGWLLTTIGLGVATYTTTAVNKIAENDFKDVKTKDIVKAAVKSIKWVLLISKHMGSLAIKRFRDVTFDSLEEEGEPLVIIENSSNEDLKVPQKYIEIYNNCPERLFNKLIKNVLTDRVFEVGFNPNEPVDADDTKYNVTVNVSEKYIFTTDEKIESILFPELVHGATVTLNGHVTRGNENSNTIGFQYSGHVITCSPVKGSVKDYKSLLFTNCVIRGEVDRSGQYSLGMEKRPHIKFDSLIGILDYNAQTKLF